MSDNKDNQDAFFQQLVQRFAEGTHTTEELEVFFHLLQQDKLDLPLLEAMNAAAYLSAIDPQDEALAAASTPPPAKAPLRRLPRYFRIAVASVLLLLLGTGAWLLLREQPVSTAPAAQVIKPPDIPAPAVNRATITLGNGQMVYLDSAANGALASQGGARIVKLANGQVAYQRKGRPLQQNELSYNILTNPRGSQVISLVLTDGTKVWLNSESSLRYPAAFTGSDRTVEITGEGYFEVAQNAEKPFYVKKGNTIIQVLGTSFNINAYADEPSMKVTLLEGKVRVAKENDKVILSPHQQAVITTEVQLFDNADLDQAVAWKNGRFTFHGADLPTVMRQLARWYNVEVTYVGKIPDLRFSGRIGRTLTLDQVLKTLTNTGVHYSIEPGNKLLIRP